MRRRNLMSCLAVAFAVVLGAVCSEQTRAAGYWNMPGTFAQRAGHGYGGGYHAPLILGPVQCDGWGLGAPSAVALCAVAVLWLRKLWRLRADGRGAEFDGERCADDRRRRQHRCRLQRLLWKRGRSNLFLPAHF